MIRALRIIGLLALLTSASAVASADDYATARAELIAAYQAQNYASMVVAADKALQARPGYPGARFNLALAYVLNGEAKASLDELESLLAADIDFGVSGIDEFAAVRELPGWNLYEQRVRALREPKGEAVVALERDDDRFVPEGIAIDAEGEILLGSIRQGKIVRGEDVLSQRQGHWSVFGMRFHNDGSLWFASAAVPQFEDVGEERDRPVGPVPLVVAVVRRDVLLGLFATRALVHEQVLGDLVITGDTIYTTDSLTGAVYRYDIATDAFTTLSPPGTFGSPQGLALDASERHLYVADYIGGLYRVGVHDGGIERLVVEGPASDYGIDGLYRHRGRLIAIQNGIRPHRVTAFRLSQDGTTITDSRLRAANLPAVDEPTLGAVHGDDFYFVANSHWNRFDEDNRLPDGLTGPIVLKLSLSD